MLFQIPLVRELLLWLGCVDASPATAKFNLFDAKKERVVVMERRKDALETIRRRRAVQQQQQEEALPFPEHGDPDELVPTGEVRELPRSLHIFVGGEREQLLASSASMASKNGKPPPITLVLNDRKGFVRLALQAGAPIVPLFCFGENDFYHTLSVDDDPWTGWLRKLLVRKFRIAIPVFFGRWGTFLPLEGAQLNLVVGAPVSLDAGDSAVAAMTQEQRVDALHAKYIQAVQALYDATKGQFGHADRELRIV